jgi:hypothetical protein
MSELEIRSTDEGARLARRDKGVAAPRLLLIFNSPGADGRDNLRLDKEGWLATNKILEKILRGTSDANIPFKGLRRVLWNLGFSERIKGSHHIYYKPGVEEILNLQPKGNKAKPYQVKQARHVILKYRLGDAPDAETEV